MDTDDSPRPLLSVKQVVPPVLANLVPRGRLLEGLGGGPSRLTVVVAPPGWGKSVLLSHWASTVPDTTRLAWVTLDQADNDPVTFWRYALTAMARASEELSSAPLATLVGGADPIALPLPLLVNELAAAAADHVLVLDDFHVVTDPRIHEGVEFLVSYLPRGSSLVIASRADPPLPLARLRERGELTEVRAENLRFTTHEAQQLVQTVTGELEPDAMEALWERTEGWAAGLQLAALRIRGSNDPNSIARAIRGDDRNLVDYLVSEVLGSLTEAARELLVRCSPLATLSGELCDVALARRGSASVLAELERAHLFVSMADDGSTYRCHRLLRDALWSEMKARGDDEERALLLRVAQWLLQHDRAEEAVQHLVMAGDHDAVTAVLLDHPEPWLFGAGSAAPYLAAGESLPSRLVDPVLAISLAYAASLIGDRSRVDHWLHECTARLRPDSIVPGWSSAEAAVDCMRAQFVVRDSEAALAVELALRSTQLESDPSTRGYVNARMALGGAYVLEGRFEDAVGLLRAAWRQRELGWSSASSLRVAGLLALCLMELGDDGALDRLLCQVRPAVLEVEEQWGTAPATLLALLRIAEGRQAHVHGDVTSAVRILTEATALAELSPRPTVPVTALVYLAEASLASDDQEAARSALATARDVVVEEGASPFALSRLSQAEARLGLQAVRTARRSGALIEPLTDRELSVLRALQGTATQREIGSALFLSVNTVKTYTKSLYRKLGVGSRLEAISAARDLRLI